MTTPRKKRGFRNVSVDGIVYRWRLALQESSGTLTIYGESSSSKKLLIELPERRDPWINFDARNLEEAALQLHGIITAEPITNAFVRRCVEAGLAKGFDPAAFAVTLVYRDGRFSGPEMRSIALPSHRSRFGRRNRSK